MFPDNLKKSVELTLTGKFGKPVQISEIRSVGGGCINESYSINTNNGRYFIKYNSATAYPGMFEKEAAGLNILADTNAITVPEVIETAETETEAYLLLKYVQSGSPCPDFWFNFGISLAELHRHNNDKFGLDHNNYIGSLVQANEPDADFVSFFISQRIEPQLKTARNKGAFGRSELRYFDSLFNSLNNIIPVEKPALLHGDLWSGNFMVSENGLPCLIDPAVYYGHRESDIAMTQLFGGFQPGFYQAYNQTWPLEKDWQHRMDIFNLYPLLVHVNLFGGGYTGQVMRIIRQF
jgi:protein-ribulosamine 3-kinase